MPKRTIVRRPAKKGNAKNHSGRKQGSPQNGQDDALWQQLHATSDRWQADLVFSYDELSFLRKLVDRNFMWLIDEEHIESIRKLSSDLSKLEERRFSVLQKVDQHRNRLASMIASSLSHDGQKCKDEHSETDVLFTGFTKEFRQIKKVVFQMASDVIESEKVKRLLSLSRQ